MENENPVELMRCRTCLREVGIDQFGTVGGDRNKTCKSCRNEISSKSYYNKKIISLDGPSPGELLFKNAKAIRLALKSMAGINFENLEDLGLHFIIQSANHNQPIPPGLFSVERKSWIEGNKTYSVILWTIQDAGAQWLLTSEYSIKRLAELLTKLGRELIPLSTKTSMEYQVEEARRFCMPRGQYPYFGPWEGKGMSISILKKKFLDHGSVFSLSEDFQLPVELVEYLAHSEKWNEQWLEILETRFQTSMAFVRETKTIESKLQGKSEPEFRK